MISKKELKNRINTLNDQINNLQKLVGNHTQNIIFNCITGGYSGVKSEYTGLFKKINDLEQYLGIEWKEEITEGYKKIKQPKKSK